jgi:NADPH:quinone reductase-like Zn-dependent oxidoreductase
MSLGADFAINYNSADFAEVISREMGGKGVNMIIDLVGHNYWHRNTEAAVMEGKIVLVAAMSGSMIERFNLRELLNKRLWVLATTLRTRDAEYQGMLRDKFVDVAMENLKNGRMGVTVDKIFSWKDIAEAHKRIEANVNAGKLICVIDS